MLDAEEYLHLAINATQQGQHHAALEYLHKSLEIEPDNAKAIFLLGAEYAELGLFDRAISGLEKCIAIEPKLEMAYYQLALLYLQKGDIDTSKSYWTHLQYKGEDPALKFFAQGMLNLEEDKTAALTMIKSGIEYAQQNPALQKGMENILNNIVSTNEEAVSEASDQPLFLGAYKDLTFGSDEK